MQNPTIKIVYSIRKEMIFHMNKHSQLKIRGHTKQFSTTFICLFRS